METKQKECEICGVWFTPSRSSQKYCPECGKDSTKAWRDLHKHMQYSVARVGTGRPVSKTEVECKYCHKTFTCYNGVTSAYSAKPVKLQTGYKIPSAPAAENQCLRRMTKETPGGTTGTAPRNAGKNT